MKLYEVLTDFGSGTRVFLKLKDARAYARAEIGGYRIDRIETPPLSAQLVIDIINSQGGRYCIDRQTIDKGVKT